MQLLNFLHDLDLSNTYKNSPELHLVAIMQNLQKGPLFLPQI